ncbi:MAG: hypothetical protein MK161_12715 [Pirellulales bacterium]|nr:hypothetical protein [Pirellulales bacterium]
MNFHNHQQTAAKLLRTALPMVLVFAGGCGDRANRVQVKGQVTFKGNPLQFGTVMFQPTSGQPAVGDIQTDGTFRLSTSPQGDGLLPGGYQVRVICFESDRPGSKPPVAQELPTRGVSLIPLKYGEYRTSGIEIEVTPELPQPVVLKLTAP